MGLAVVALAFIGVAVRRAINDVSTIPSYATYVTGCPRLCTYTDAEFATILDLHISPYFTHNDLAVSEVKNLRVAWRNFLDALWVVRFTATPEQIATLVAGKTALGGENVLEELRRTGSIQTGPVKIGDVEHDAVFWGDSSHLCEPPFDRLSWWPPKSRRRGSLETYYESGKWKSDYVKYLR